MSNQPEASITHIWNRFNPRWLIAGGLAGVLAGIAILAMASIISASHLGEWSQATKLIGSMYYGRDGYEGTAFSAYGPSFFFGLVVHLGLSALFGMTFAQLVDERSSEISFIVLGLVTSFIIWIFGCKLFMPSVNIVLANALPTIPGLLLHLAFGLMFGIFLQITRLVFIR